MNSAVSNGACYSGYSRGGFALLEGHAGLLLGLCGREAEIATRYATIYPRGWGPAARFLCHCAPCSLVSLFADDHEPAAAAAATVRPTADAIAPKAEAAVVPKAQQPPKAQPVDSLFKVGTEPQSSLNQCVHSFVPAADLQRPLWYRPRLTLSTLDSVCWAVQAVESDDTDGLFGSSSRNIAQPAVPTKDLGR